VDQFIAHTAFYTATRLLLVRAWEDSGLLTSPVLYNGGFDALMTALNDVGQVVRTAFDRASEFYPDLFSRHNAFSWYRPSHQVYVDAVYELANTYLGDLSDDVLGEVYQQQLARLDRKQLGQYYTPRDVIKLIWDLVGIDGLAARADAEDRPVRVLDVATGSGGFIVEGAARLRRRYQAARAEGDATPPRRWLTDVTDGLVACEIQQFSAYLAEVNLVLQFSPLLQGETGVRIPGLRVHCVDTLTMHNADRLGSDDPELPEDDGGGHGAVRAAAQRGSIDRLRDPEGSGEWLDAAVGNPPYVGEKSIAKTMGELQSRHPYWQQFSAAHQDYLYAFLILGVSKLRQGGRFGFITTEYWLKATGAAPLRKYLAEHCRVDRLVLFRDLTLFPDATGQHNLILVGERLTDPAGKEPRRAGGKPRVSVYTGPARPASRTPSLDAIRGGDGRVAASTMVRNFVSRRDPATLGERSWAETVMTAEQLGRRDAVRASTSKAGLVMSEGVIATPQALKESHEAHLTQQALLAVGGPGSKAGIFVLSADEVANLSERHGGFTDAEARHLRPVINTRDVFPYGAVLPPDPAQLIWLPSSHGGLGGAFPDDMPAFREHLEQFKPLLEATVRKYGVNRPWWSAHNPRTQLVDGHPDTGRWADLGVTTRWGDRKLVTGLAPARSLPLSGLHALSGGMTGTKAAYLVGLINSTPVQELAEALAPGSLSQQDVEHLGLPQFAPDAAGIVAVRARDLADAVRRLVTEHGQVWPMLPDILRQDLPLAADVTVEWAPAVGRRGWGTLQSVGWATLSSEARVVGVVETVELDDAGLFGNTITVGFTRGSLKVDVSDPEGRDLRPVVRSLIVGTGRATRDELYALAVPVDAAALRNAWDRDAAGVGGLVREYQRLRAEVDDIASDALAR